MDRLVAAADPGVGISDASVTAGTAGVLVGNTRVGGIVGAIAATLVCARCDRCLRRAGVVRRGRARRGSGGNLVVGDIAGRLSALLLVAALVGRGQFSRAELGDTRRLGWELAPVLSVVATGRCGGISRIAGTSRIRRRNVCWAFHRLLASSVGALRNPVKVSAVEEDSSTPTSIESGGVARLVKDKGHQRYPDHLLVVEKRSHLG